MSIRSRLTRSVATRAGAKLAPGPAANVVHKALDRAITGVGPLPGAAASAESHLSVEARTALRAGKPVDRQELNRAADELVTSHLRLAATQGFLTNVGGLASMAATVPANLAGLALVQTHLIAALAHLGGHDLSDPLVREVVLVTLLGRDNVDDLVKKGTLTGTPRQLLADDDTLGATDLAALARLVGTEVSRDLVTRASGRGLAGAVGRRVPVLGGAVGAGSDALSTRSLGSYATAELIG